MSPRCRTRIGAFALAAQGAGHTDSNSIRMPASHTEQATGGGSAPAAPAMSRTHVRRTSGARHSRLVSRHGARRGSLRAAQAASHTLV